MIDAVAMSEELSSAAAPKAQPLASLFSSVAAPLLSVAVHAALAFGAAHLSFEHGETRSASVDFRRGSSREIQVQLRLVMAEPAAPAESNNRAQPAPTPQRKASEPRSAVNTAPPANASFSGLPGVPRNPVDGGSPGHAAKAEQALPGESAEVDRHLPELSPVNSEAQSVIAPTTATGESGAGKPTQPTEHSFAAAAAPSRADSKPDHLTGVPSFATPPAPSIDLSAAAAPTDSGTARPPSPSASAAASRPAAGGAPSRAGISTGVDIDRLVEPRYPEESVRAREEGTVVLEIEVLPDGTVGQVRVLESPGFRLLEKAAIDAVRRSRFKPATRGGVAVRDVLRKPFVFRVIDQGGR